MTMLSLPRIAGEDSREIRALELHAALGRHIHQLAENVYEVPSSCGKKIYTVRYGGLEESCTCPDAVFNPGISCKHLLMLGIAHGARRRRCRPHTFECSSCASRLPIVQAVVVGADEAQRTILREAEERFLHEIMESDEERQLLLDRIKRLRRVLGLMVG